MDCMASNNEKSHFIPSEVRLALFKASVVGRNDAKNIIKKVHKKKCLPTKSMNDRSKDHNDCTLVLNTNLKHTNLFEDYLGLNKMNVTLNSKTTFNEIETASTLDNSNPNESFIHTPNKNPYPCDNLALSGIKKLDQSPNQPSRQNYLRSTNHKNVLARPTPLDTNVPNNLQELTSVLSGMVVFVDVRSESENRSQGVISEVNFLGAKVENNLTKKVTIIVFKDGLMSVYKKAKQWDIPMVSVLWVEACKNEQVVVPIEQYPPLNIDKYETACDVGSISKKKNYAKKVKVVPEATGPTQDGNQVKDAATIKIRNIKASELGKNTLHEDSFIHALLALDGDELKEFLNRPLGYRNEDDDSDIAIPLSVRLLHKHVVERRALTSVKDYLGNLEDNVKTLSDRGRLKLRKLVFPKEQECEKGTERIQSGNQENENNNREINLIEHELDKASARLLAKSRQSAPPKLTHTNTYNILKYCYKITDNGGPTLDSLNDLPCKRLADETNSSSTSTDVLQNVTNRTKSKKKKLFTSNLNVDTTELSDSNTYHTCEPFSFACPYVESPKKNKKIVSSNLEINTVSKNNTDENNLDVLPNNENSPSIRRESSVLFIDAKGKKAGPPRTPTIVCTSIIRKDKASIIAMVNKLGKFSIERSVNERTTHVVTSVARRTINLLKGIARGIWILKDEWIYKSFESGKWLNEEPFELVEFSPSVKQSRIERLAFGPEFCLELFNTAGYIYVCRNTNPSSADLEDLLRICGGKVVTSPVVANVIVGSHMDEHSDAILVKENWILDSVASNKSVSPQLYRLLS